MNTSEPRRAFFTKERSIPRSSLREGTFHRWCSGSDCLGCEKRGFIQYQFVL